MTRQSGRQLAGCLRPFTNLFECHGYGRFAAERRAAGEDFVKDQPQRVDIGSLIRGLPSACSGAIYAGVPMIAPVAVTPAAYDREIPSPSPSARRPW